MCMEDIGYLKRKWSSWITCHRFVNGKENGCRFQAQRKETNKDLHAACLVNSCQGKDAGVLFRLNYSIHQHTSIGCDTSLLVGTFNLAEVNIVPCMCEATLSLLDSE